MYVILFSEGGILILAKRNIQESERPRRVPILQQMKEDHLHVQNIKQISCTYKLLRIHAEGSLWNKTVRNNINIYIFKPNCTNHPGKKQNEEKRWPIWHSEAYVATRNIQDLLCVCMYTFTGNRKSFQEIKTTFFCKQGITQESLSWIWKTGRERERERERERGYWPGFLFR